MNNPKTTTGSGAPEYKKFKIEGEAVDRFLALDDAAKVKIDAWEKDINAIDEQMKGEMVRHTAEVNEMVGKEIGLAGTDIVIISVDSQLKLLIGREKTEGEKKRDAEIKAQREAEAAKEPANDK